MNKVLIATLLSSISFAIFASQAEAKHRFCQINPDDPACEQVSNEDQFYTPADRYADEDEYDDEDYVPRERYRPRRVVNSCNGIAQFLRDKGYRRIRAKDCQGKSYKYLAVRRGQRVVVEVDSRYVRIKAVVAY